jgi:hypothetical protein
VSNTKERRGWRSFVRAAWRAWLELACQNSRLTATPAKE